MEKIYINDIEAAKRYGISRTWFQHRRHSKKPPEFLKMDSGSILYDIEKTDKWFESHKVSLP